MPSGVITLTLSWKPPRADELLRYDQAQSWKGERVLSNREAIEPAIYEADFDLRLQTAAGSRPALEILEINYQSTSICDMVKR